MPQPRQRLRNLKVSEVSLVDEGDNPGARVVMFKRRTAKQPAAGDVSTDAPLGDREPARRRPRRRRGAVDGDNAVAKLTAQTSAAGEGPHTHPIELPDGAIAGGTFRTERVEGHFHDVVLPDMQPGDTTNVETSVGDDHTHSLEVTAVERVTQRREKQDQDFRTQGGTRFRRNAWALNAGNPSEWKLRLFDSQADADANRPSVRLTAAAAQALGPAGFRGQRVQLPSGARQRVIGRVRAAWLRARRQAGQEVGRDDLPTVLKGHVMGRLLDKFYEMLGRDDPEEEIEKRLFDEIRADTMNEQVADAVLSRVGDFAHSVRSILFGPDEDEDGNTLNKQALIGTSLGQFVENMEGELGDIFAGRIVKLFEDDDDDLDDAEVEKRLRAFFNDDEPPADSASATQKEGQMDLSKLSKEDRAEVEAALDKAGTVDELTQSNEAKDAEIAKLTKADGDDTDPDPLEALPDEVRKVVDPLLKAANDRADKAEESNTSLTKRLDVIEADTARTKFEKSVGDLTGLPQKRDEIIDLLWTMTDDDARGTMQKNLEAAAAAARRGNVFGEIGSGIGGGDTGSAYAKIEAAAVEIRKADPSMTIEKARAQAMNDNPDLYDSYLEESDARTPIN